jgi:hypothetical protein
MQQKLAEKEKAQKEENLRMLAQRAREERSGFAPSKPSATTTAQSRTAMKSGLADYGSDSGSESEASDREERRGDGDSEEEEAAKLRDEMRREKRMEREREMRMSNMGTEQRAKMLARQQNRDISEKVALGLAKPTMSKESMLDSRLFNQESLSNNFADDDAYNLYDRPLFHGSSAAAAIYKARGNITEGNDESFGGGTEEGISRAWITTGLALDELRLGSRAPTNRRYGRDLCSSRRILEMCLAWINSWTRPRVEGRGVWIPKCTFLPLATITYSHRLISTISQRWHHGNDNKWTRRRNVSRSVLGLLLFFRCNIL